jgi:hypothetical protein
MTIREINIQDYFVKYLISKGYPENSIAVDPVYEHLGRKYRPDVVIVDPDSNQPLAIFEIKKIKNDHTLDVAIQQLTNYSNAVKSPDVLLYAVFPTRADEKTMGFEIIPINQKDISEKDSNVTEEQKSISQKSVDPPVFTILKNSRLTQEISKIANEQESTIDYFQILCLVSAIFVFLVLIADILNYFKIDVQRLALIGVIVGLFILPYASKLKILGFEFERLTQSKKGKTE